jgi:hypothetical protein
MQDCHEKNSIQQQQQQQQQQLSTGNLTLIQGANYLSATLEAKLFTVLKFGNFVKYIENTWKVLKRGGVVNKLGRTCPE